MVAGSLCSSWGILFLAFVGFHKSLAAIYPGAAELGPINGGAPSTFGAGWQPPSPNEPRPPPLDKSQTGRGVGGTGSGGGGGGGGGGTQSANSQTSAVDTIRRVIQTFKRLNSYDPSASGLGPKQVPDSYIRALQSLQQQFKAATLNNNAPVSPAKPVLPPNSWSSKTIQSAPRQQLPPQRLVPPPQSPMAQAPQRYPNPQQYQAPQRPPAPQRLPSPPQQPAPARPVFVQNNAAATSPARANPPPRSSASALTNSWYSMSGGECSGYMPGQLCCDGIANPLPASGARHQFACCHKTLYNIETQICCNDYPMPKPTGVQGPRMCCGHSLYDPRTHICCDKFPMPNQGGALKCCKKGPYNPATQMCCGESVKPRPAGMKHMDCCGKHMYNPQTHMCCEEGNTFLKTPGMSCCGKNMFAPAAQKCCFGDAIPKMAPCWAK